MRPLGAAGRAAAVFCVLVAGQAAAATDPFPILDLKPSTAGNRLVYSVTEWCGEQPPDCRVLAFRCESGRILVEHNAMRGWSLPRDLFFDGALSLRARSPDYPYKVRRPTIEFWLTRIEREEPGKDWIATFEAEAPPLSVLEYLEVNPVFQMMSPGYSIPFRARVLDPGKMSPVMDFAGRCREQVR